MGCGCNGGARANSNGAGDTLGFRAFLPNGEVVPPVTEAPFFMAAEAMPYVTTARGGTVRRIYREDQVDAYAIAQRAALETAVT